MKDNSDNYNSDSQSLVETEGLSNSESCVEGEALATEDGNGSVESALQGSTTNATPLTDEEITQAIIDNEQNLALLQRQAMEEAEKVVEESEVTPLDRLEELSNDVKKLFVDYTDDIDHAYAVGVSGIFDDYHREILEPVFENLLRLSDNTTKLIYSKVKNALLGCREVSQLYDDGREWFLFDNKKIVCVFFDGGKINFGFCLSPEDADKKTYKYTVSKTEKDTPLVISNGISAEGVERLLGLIDILKKVYRLEIKKVYVPVAYAERYPFCNDYVLRGEEDKAPVIGQYDGDEYDIIVGELSTNLLEELFAGKFDNKTNKQKLEALRQKADTIKGAVALTEPIVYFYDSALNADSTIAFVNAQQVLNDKFMGKVLPQQFFTIAEDSDRIETLNELCLREIVGDCNRMLKFKFCTQVSCRWLLKDSNIAKLIGMSATENHNLILAFDCTLLSALGSVGAKAISSLRESGLQILAENVENATMSFLTEFDIDYYRFDARLYGEEDIRRLAQLDIVLNYAKVQGIVTVANNVENIKQAKLLLSHGVEVITGDVIGTPKRLVTVAVKEIQKLPLIGG